MTANYSVTDEKHRELQQHADHHSDGNERRARRQCCECPTLTTTEDTLTPLTIRISVSDIDEGREWFVDHVTAVNGNCRLYRPQAFWFRAVVRKR